jgi:hypothetical protein
VGRSAHGNRRDIDENHPMLAILRFEPIILYIALGLCAVIGVGRLLLGWAIPD